MATKPEWTTLIWNAVELSTKAAASEDLEKCNRLSDKIVTPDTENTEMKRKKHEARTKDVE